MDPRVHALIHTLHGDLTQQVPVSRLALLVGASPSRLRALFKRDTGLPPSRYLKHLRLDHARTLLCTTHFSVKEIMVAVGCADESHFVRDFEKSYGHSPKRYRALHSASTSQNCERTSQ